MDVTRVRKTRRRGSLRAFQEELSRRIAAAGTVVRKDVRLLVQCGSSGWLIRLPDAGELVPPPDLTRVPLTQPWLRGLANVRGTLYAVVDLAAFSGEAPIAGKAAARLMLVGQRYGNNSALLVERVIGLRNLADFSEIERTRSEQWAGSQYRDADGQHWSELEIEALLQAPEFLQVGV
jgi:twitching motility protein PilI